MARNEADIIEAFVRHNLRSLDRLIVVDHGSSDGTREILHALSDEGLPLAVEHDDRDVRRQPETITRLARRAFAEGSNAVFALDADEFLKMPSRAAFDRWMTIVPPSCCVGVEWQTYLPKSMTHVAGASVSLEWRRGTEAHGLHKVLLTRAFAQTPAATVGPGNHLVLMDGPMQDLSTHPAQLVICPPIVAAIAHLPVRSVDQIVRKVRRGWTQRMKTDPTERTLSVHWRDLYADFASRGPPDAERYRALAANYGLAMEHWQPIAAVPIVVDPVRMMEPNRYDALARPMAA
jgi:hypothetical protein